MTRPLGVSILDEQYVIVLESMETRRISVFDLLGRFVRIVQEADPIQSAIAVGQGKIAIVTGRVDEDYQKTDTISLRDIRDDGTIPIASFAHDLPSRSRIRIPSCHPAVHLAGMDPNSLLVGFSGEGGFRSTRARASGSPGFPWAFNGAGSSETRSRLF